MTRSGACFGQSLSDRVSALSSVAEFPVVFRFSQISCCVLIFLGFSTVPRFSFEALRYDQRFSFDSAILPGLWAECAWKCSSGTLPGLRAAITPGGTDGRG